MSRHLIALALAAFGIDTGEYVMIGLLSNVAADFDVSIDTAGLLINTYAMGVAVGAPIMAIMISKLPRKTTLIGLICAFTVRNFLCALAPSYESLMLARIVTAFCNGAFLGLGAVVASDLAPSNRRSSAIALMFSSITVANIMGVRLGTALGQLSNWRSVFWGVSLLGLLATAALAVRLPRNIPMRKGKLLQEFRVLADIRVLWPLLASVLVSAATFSVLAYMSPLLQTITRVTEHWVTVFLLIFGIALTVGSTLGGKLCNRNREVSLRWMFFFLLLMVLFMNKTMHAMVPIMATVFVWDILAFAVVPLLQTLVVDQASAAPNLASTLKQGYSTWAMGWALG